MRRLTALGALLMLFAGLGSGTAVAGNMKLVEGTVYDATCVAVCQPECPPPPHCGPVPVTNGKRNVICAQAAIVCPLYRVAPSDPVYAGEGGIVKVRKRGSETVIATVPIVEGHFKVQLGFGEYVVRPFLSEPQCWQGPPIGVWVSRQLRGPVPASFWVVNECVRS